MEQTKLFSRVSGGFFFALLLINILTSHSAAENDYTQVRHIQVDSSEEFDFVGKERAVFTIRPLKPKLRAIENLQNTQAVGISYLGTIILTRNATPLSALRDISVQISSGLNINLALITDSITSRSLQPHAMLLLYHPSLVITLALTRMPQSNQYSLFGSYAAPANHAP